MGLYFFIYICSMILVLHCIHSTDCVNCIYVINEYIHVGSLVQTSIQGSDVVQGQKNGRNVEIHEACLSLRRGKTQPHVAHVT